MQRRDVDKLYTDTKAELETKLTNANELLEEIKQKLQESESNRQQSSTSLASLNESYQSAITLINQTSSDLAKVTELRAVALDPTNGLEPLLSKVQITAEKAEQLLAKLNDYTKVSNENSEQVQKDTGEVKKSLNATTAVEKQANNLLQKIEKTYQLAINTGLAGSFNKREIEIHAQYVQKWATRFNRSLLTISIIAAVVLCISWFKKDFTLETLTFFRLSLLTPLIFYTGYAAYQYNSERRYLEKYAFKAAVGASLEGYVEVLNQKFGDEKHEDIIIKFVINAMNTIYEVPHEDIKVRRVGISMGNKLAKLKSEMVEEVVERVKVNQSN